MELCPPFKHYGGTMQSHFVTQFYLKKITLN